MEGAGRDSEAEKDFGWSWQGIRGRLTRRKWEGLKGNGGPQREPRGNKWASEETRGPQREQVGLKGNGRAFKGPKMASEGHARVLK